MDRPGEWWKSFFDESYVRLWAGALTTERSAQDADGLWTLAALGPGAQVLDAPCGYGRLSRLLAERGALVLGVDQSETQLEIAERRRDGIAEDRLRYLRHDLRAPLDESGFDAALCVYSSIGYGSEADDRAIVANLAAALRPGGRLVLETRHRDSVVSSLAHGGPPGQRLADGTLLVEEPRLDPLTSRIETTWYWYGPQGPGEKRASLRIYAPSELIALIGEAGLELVSLHAGCTPEPFCAGGPAGKEMSRRIGVLARRPLA
jgi:SAM-dependent methyltransferase